VGTMDFDRLLDGAEVAGDLFVQFASDDIFEHFPLTPTKLCKRLFILISRFSYQNDLLSIPWLA
jgi:hypothetical protein